MFRMAYYSRCPCTRSWLLEDGVSNRTPYDKQYPWLALPGGRNSEFDIQDLKMWTTAKLTLQPDGSRKPLPACFARAVP